MNWIRDHWFYLACAALGVSRLFHLSPHMDAFYAHRQCDTAFYAWDFYKNGIDLLHPAVCWLGGHKILILEFPLHEAITALLYDAFGFSHVWARLVTLSFYFLGVVYFYRLVRACADLALARLATLVYLALPLGLVLSRAIHVDFVAIGLAHMAVYHCLAAYKRGRLVDFLLFAGAATLSALVKIPYLFYFAIPLGLLVIADWKTKRVVCLIIAAIVPAVLFLIWRKHVFTVNALAPDWRFIPGYYTFTHMASWYFGPLEMRFDPANWWIIAKRCVLDIATPTGLLLMLLGCVGDLRKRTKPWFFLGWLAGTIVYVLIFFRLNVIHHYYQSPLLAISAVYIARGIFTLSADLSKRLHWPQVRLQVAGFMLVILPAFAWAEVPWPRGLPKSGYYLQNTYAELIGEHIQRHASEDELVVAAFTSTQWCDPRILYSARRFGWALQTQDLSGPALSGYIEEGADWLAVFGVHDLSPLVAQLIKDCPVWTYSVMWDEDALKIYQLSPKP
ncbi:MAG: 4-amino-4-deoxy-L-arabinose transferase-like glycosyltransferase [Kiritimatiellia bacterium]|jgi:4-amino-4-deoxy-L-arabinose transferase-like glycosyltransferase